MCERYSTKIYFNYHLQLLIALQRDEKAQKWLSELAGNAIHFYHLSFVSLFLCWYYFSPVQHFRCKNKLGISDNVRY